MRLSESLAPTKAEINALYFATHSPARIPATDYRRREWPPESGLARVVRNR
jgi:hypothetical protein